MRRDPVPHADQSEPADEIDDETFEPAVGLDDPRVSAVPETTPRPGESDAHAAARLLRGGQDAWGAPEDQPDHEGNEVYDQHKETRSRR